YFAAKPGSILDRLMSSDTLARMPKTGVRWPTKDIEAEAKIACEAQALGEQGGPPIDEQFPPNLLTAYSGAASTDYDNSFINFVQLKGKVQVVFGDNWVRSSVDQFAANIGLFGGADFVTRYNEARTATSDFLLGLDKMAPDICDKAATGLSGPFV